MIKLRLPVKSSPGPLLCSPLLLYLPPFAFPPSLPTSPSHPLTLDPSQCQMFRSLVMLQCFLKPRRCTNNLSTKYGAEVEGKVGLRNLSVRLELGLIFGTKPITTSSGRVILRDRQGLVCLGFGKGQTYGFNLHFSKQVARTGDYFFSGNAFQTDDEALLGRFGPT